MRSTGLQQNLDILVVQGQLLFSNHVTAAFSMFRFALFWI